MLIASNRGVGQNICAPDVCLTPIAGVPVPIPYVNIGMHATAVAFAPTVFLSMVNALNITSIIPMTLGDQPGVLGPGPGLQGQFLVGCPNVLIDMAPAVTLTTPALGNMGNAPGAVLVPSVCTVFFNFAGPPAKQSPELDAADLEALRDALESLPPLSAMLLDEGVGVLRITGFATDLPRKAYLAIEQLTQQGMTSLVIDLRDSPGGDLDAAIAFAGDFLPAGAIIARVVDADGDETIHRSRREKPYAMPVMILVSHRTASAAELFAGSLKAHGRALVAGEATLGKGTIQQLIPGEDGVSTRYATTAICRLPGGEPIEGAGVAPDLAVRDR